MVYQGREEIHGRLALGKTIGSAALITATDAYAIKDTSLLCRSKSRIPWRCLRRGITDLNASNASARGAAIAYKRHRRCGNIVRTDKARDGAMYPQRGIHRLL
jgi:hypothetical protein